MRKICKSTSLKRLYLQKQVFIVIFVLGIHNNMFYCNVSTLARYLRLMYPYKESCTATTPPKQPPVNFDCLRLSFMLQNAISVSKRRDDQKKEIPPMHVFC